MVVRLPSEKLILPYFSGSRGVAISVPFPEVRNRKGAESGLVEDIFEDDEEVDNAKLALHSMIAADFATFAVLVSFGVLLGKYILINITFMHHTQKPLPIYQLLIQFIIICLCISLNIKS